MPTMIGRYLVYTNDKVNSEFADLACETFIIGKSDADTPSVITSIEGLTGSADLSTQNVRAPYVDGTNTLATLYEPRTITITGYLVTPPHDRAAQLAARRTLLKRLNPTPCGFFRTLTYDNGLFFAGGPGYVYGSLAFADIANLPRMIWAIPTKVLFPWCDYKTPYQPFQIEFFCPEPFFRDSTNPYQAVVSTSQSGVISSTSVSGATAGTGCDVYSEPSVKVNISSVSAIGAFRADLYFNGETVWMGTISTGSNCFSVELQISLTKKLKNAKVIGNNAYLTQSQFYNPTTLPIKPTGSSFELRTSYLPPFTSSGITTTIKIQSYAYYLGA